jgi:hypothetical protein
MWEEIPDVTGVFQPFDQWVQLPVPRSIVQLEKWIKGPLYKVIEENWSSQNAMKLLDNYYALIYEDVSKHLFSLEKMTHPKKVDREPLARRHASISEHRFSCSS